MPLPANLKQLVTIVLDLTGSNIERKEPEFIRENICKIDKYFLITDNFKICKAMNSNNDSNSSNHNTRSRSSDSTNGNRTQTRNNKN